MGLIITTPIHTNKGQTSEMYVNIDNIMVIKSDTQSVSLNRYINKSSRESNQNDKCDSFEVLGNYNYNLNISDLTANSIYDVMYTKLKNDLIANGFSVEND